MHILVAGGAGFVGTNLVLKLLSQGHHVHCVDNLVTAAKSNVDFLRAKKNMTFTEMDITDPQLLQLSGFDQIYNLACPASPPQYQKRMVDTLRSCSVGVENVIQLALKEDAKVLQASTSEVYGDPLVSPQSEDYWGNVNPIGIRSCYNEGKRYAESLLYSYTKEQGLKSVVIRLFNTYGPYMDPLDGRVVSNFIIQAMNGEDLTIYGTGEQTRSFCYVDDLVEGLIAAMNRDVEGVINLGSLEEVSMNELADMTLEMIPSAKGIVYYPVPEDDPVQRKPDISKAKKLLDWEPKTSLMEGLKKTFAYYEAFYYQNSKKS